MKLIGKTKFISNKKYYLNFFRTSKKDFFKKFPSCEKEVHGMCVYRFNSNRSNICNIYIIEDYEDLPLWIHEITHAAVSFLEDKSFTSEKFLSFSDKEKDEYIHESIPRMVEKLTRSLIRFLKK